MNIQSILGDIAPFISSLFGSPLAGVAVKTLGKALLGDENASQKEIEKELSKASPEILVKLKEVDADLKKKFMEVGINEKKLQIMDRMSARDMQVKNHDVMPAVLSVLLTIGFFSILIFLSFFDIPKGSVNLINIMIGSIGTSWASMISYYFGSSHGSNMKTKLMGTYNNEKV